MSMQVINDNDVLNIDSTFHNLCMWKKLDISELENLGPVFSPPDIPNQFPAYGQFVPGEYYDGSKPFTLMSQYRYAIPSSIKTPIIAIGVFKNYPFAGTVSVENGITYAYVYTTYTGPFSVYIFSQTKTKSERYGLEIFNKNSEVVFDSSNKYMRILPAIATDKTCALVLHGVASNHTIVGVDPGYANFWKCYMETFFINSANELKKSRVYTQGSYNEYDYRPFFTGVGYDNTPFVLDVTNY